MKKIIFVFLIFSILIFNSTFAAINLKELKLPSNIKISIYAENIDAARQMTLAPNGTVFVGTKSGYVYALLPEKQFTQAKQVLIIAKNLNAPNGVAFHNNALYVAEINQVLEYPNILNTLSAIPKPIIIKEQLPTDRWHGLRYIKFGPDGWLYMGIGMPCNICLQKNPMFGTIVRMKSDGSDLQIYAKGIRNSVGFAWNPIDNSLWFTDNGRDWLGDNLPPDEINHAAKAGLNFGFPYVYGDNIPDPLFKNDDLSKANFSEPAWNLPAHVAPLGMIFYTGKQLPSEFHNQILFAEHGSWNRSKKIGYGIYAAILQNNKIIRVEPFITGWLQGQSSWGRPVDLLQLPDGSVLISDDSADVIYRVSNQQ